jgi:hypothetical protein
MKFKYLYIALVLLGVYSIPIFGQSFSQVTWNTFEEKDGLFSIQIPSNWNASELTGAEALASIDYMFRYNDKGNSFAWVELLISESLYSDSRTAAEAYVEDYQQYEDFQLLEPIACDRYSLNNASACSVLSSQQLEGEQRRNVLNVVSVTPDGIQTDAVFVVSKNVYEPFLPVGEFVIDTLKINSNRVDQVLNGNDSARSLNLSPFTIKASQEALDLVSICAPLEKALYHSCNELINSNGSLSSIGQSTLKCIVSGYAIGGLASLIIPLDKVLEGLNILSERTGCAGLVKMDVLNSIVNVDNILIQLGKLLRANLS